MKKALKISEQIKVLKERGLIINDDEKAEELLLDIGYYRLGFYWYHFQEKGTHKFLDGISLDDVVRLYYFDSDLKNLLSKYVYRIEVHFRTQVVYYVSNYYKNNPLWFIDPKVVNNSFLKKFNNIYTDIIKINGILKKHHTKYKDDSHAPVWKTFEFLTFGQVYKFYYNLKEDGLKNQIAGVYGLRQSKLLDNYFRAIINIRNICSHNAVLYDYFQPTGIRRIPNIYYRIKNQQNSNLNASLRLILFILSEISNNRAKELEKGLKELFEDGRKNKFVNRMIDEKIIFDL